MIEITEQFKNDMEDLIANAILDAGRGGVEFKGDTMYLRTIDKKNKVDYIDITDLIMTFSDILICDVITYYAYKDVPKGTYSQ